MLESRRCGPRCRSGEIGRRKGLKIWSQPGETAKHQASSSDPPLPDPVPKSVSDNPFPSLATLATFSCSLYAPSTTMAKSGDVAKLADAQDLKSWGSKSRMGSSPIIPTTSKLPACILKRGDVFRVSVTVNAVSARQARRTI